MSVWRYLYRLYRPRQGWLMVAFLCLTLTWLSAAALLALSGWFITSSAMAGLGLLIGLNIFTPSAAIRALAILRTLGRYAERVIGHEAILRILADLRVRAFTALARRPAKLTDVVRHTDLVTRLTADVDTLDGMPLRVFGPMIAALLTWVTVVVVALIWGGWPIALIVAVGGALTFGAAIWGASQGNLQGQQVIESRSQQRVAVTDHLSGLAELTAYSRRQRSGQALEQLDQAQTDRLMHQEHYASISEHLVQALTAVMTLAVLVLAWPKLDAAVVTLLALMTLGMNEALGTLPGAFWRVGESTQAARRLMQLESQPNVSHDAVSAMALPHRQSLAHQPTIEIVNLSCARQATQTALLNARLSRGQPWVIHGPSGSGKTSLLATLAGELAPVQGQLRIDGIDVLALEDSQRYKLISFLSQNDVLLDLSIREFLTLGLESVDHSRLSEVLHAVDLLQTLEQTPEGLDYRLGVGGSRISGGQARRLQLAALLLHTPELVLLDEPFRGLELDLVQTMVERITPWLLARCAVIVTHDPQTLPESWPRQRWPVSGHA